MLRLSHRILSHKTYYPDLSVDSECDKFMSSVRRCIGGTVLTVDNIYQLYEQYHVKTEKHIPAEHVEEFLDLIADGIPASMPITDRLFVEWNGRESTPTMQHGWAFDTIDCQDGFKTLASNITVFRDSGGIPALMPTGAIINWDNRGTLTSVDMTTAMRSDVDPFIALDVNSFRRALLALAFCHCKNVVRRDVTDSLAPPAKWLRRQKVPEIRYHVLDINPMKEVLRTEGGIESNGLKKALHICRGHFVTYTEERPLFGKVTGTFWKPSHVRGNAERGIVDKDYRLRSPAGVASK